MKRKRRRSLGVACAFLALFAIAVAVASLWIIAGFGHYCVITCGVFLVYAD